MTRFTLLIALCWMPWQPAMAEIYRWVDEHGKVHFGDEPRSGAARVQIQSPVVSSGIPAPQRPQSALERQRALADQFQQQRQLREQQQQQDAVAQARRNQHCQRLKNKILNYQDADRLYSRNDQGEKYYLDKVSKQREIRQLEQRYDEQCS